MTTLGDIIKEYRTSEDRNISIRTFASMSGLSPSYISMLERGYDQRGNEISPSISTISVVASAMNKSFEDVFNKLDCNVIVNESIQNTLNPKEKEIIKMYRTLTPSRKKDIYNYTKMLYEDERKNASSENLA